MQPSEQIKEKLNIVDFVRNYIELKPAGRNFKGLCPFHGEKTPSFMVSRERQIWHCFGCGLGGDIFKFLMQYENIEFHEALKILAEKAGIELRKASPEDYRQFGVLYDICDAAKNYYSESFKKFPVGHEYLSKRGLKDEIIAEFEIGFAPNEYDKTTTHLIQKGFKVDDIIRSGIAFKSESGKVGDRFRGRIMFPIHDHSGKVVGFTGRILPELEDKTDMGKYVNSPETPIFNKSKTLYGFWRTKKGIREEKCALMVEGQMDFLMTYQSGVKNVIATSGTALTPEHLKTLKPIADKIILSFDNDQAGATAIERAIDLAGGADMNVAVLDLGNYKDPGDAASADPDFMKSAAKSARLGMEFYFDKYLKGELVRSKNNVRAVLSKIKRIYSPIERANWLRDLSYKVDMTEKDLRDEMDKIELEPGPADKLKKEIQETKKEEEKRIDLISFRILSILNSRKDLYGDGHFVSLMPPKYQEAVKLLRGENINWKQLDEALDGRINELTFASDIESGNDKEEVEKEFRSLIRELESESYKGKIAVLQKEIAMLERKGNDAELMEKLRQFDELTKRRHNKADIKKPPITSAS